MFYPCMLILQYCYLLGKFDSEWHYFGCLTKPWSNFDNVTPTFYQFVMNHRLVLFQNCILTELEIKYWLLEEYIILKHV